MSKQPKPVRVAGLDVRFVRTLNDGDYVLFSRVDACGTHISFSIDVAGAQKVADIINELVPRTKEPTP